MAELLRCVPEQSCICSGFELDFGLATYLMVGLPLGQVYEVLLCLGTLMAVLADWGLQRVAGGWRWMVGLPILPAIVLSGAQPWSCPKLTTISFCLLRWV